MEPKFQSSFIPKGPVATTATMNVGAKVKGAGLLGILGLFIFILAFVGAVGLFGYNWYLTSKIARMGESLEEARAALEPETINQIARLDARIVGTRELLDKHVVSSGVFDYLEDATLKSVRFSEFAFTSGGEKGLSLTMKGQAHGYGSVALQSDIFNKSKFFKNPVFSDLSLDDKGNVVFTFTTSLDPSLVSFKRYLQDENTTPVSAPVEAQNVSAVASTTATTTKTTKTTTKSSTTASTTPKR